MPIVVLIAMPVAMHRLSGASPVGPGIISSFGVGVAKQVGQEVARERFGVLSC